MRKIGIWHWAGVALLGAGLLLSPPSLAAEEPSFPITIKNHRFEPAELQVPAGTKVKLVIRNADATPEEFESRTLHREKVVAGGSEITVYVGPLSAGTYDFFGDFNPSTAQGRLVAK